MSLTITVWSLSLSLGIACNGGAWLAFTVGPWLLEFDLRSGLFVGRA